MFDTLKLYVWYLNRRRFLNGRRRWANFHLNYTRNVQNSDWSRKNFGDRDMVYTFLLPSANPKKGQAGGLSSSNDAERRALKIIPKELEKLERFRRRYIKFKKPYGKINLGNKESGFVIRSDGKTTKVVVEESTPKKPKISFISKRSLEKQYDIVYKVLKKHQPNLCGRIERSKEQDGLTEFHHTLWYLPFFNKLYQLNQTLYCMIVDPVDDTLDLFHIKMWKIVDGKVIKKTFDLRTNFHSMFNGMMQLEPIKDFPKEVKEMINCKIENKTTEKEEI